MRAMLLLILFFCIETSDIKAQNNELHSWVQESEGIVSIDTINMENPVVVFNKKTKQVFLSEYEKIPKIRKRGLYKAEEYGLIYLISHCFYCHLPDSTELIQFYAEKIGERRGITLFKKQGKYHISRYNQAYNTFIILEVSTKYYNEEESSSEGGWYFKGDHTHKLIFPLKVAK